MSQDVTQRAAFECYYMSNHLVDPVMRCIQYRVEATVSRDTVADISDVVIEFSQLKRILESVLPDKSYLYSTLVDFDHSYGTPASIKLAQYLQNELAFNAIGYPFIISAENLCAHIAHELQRQLSKAPNLPTGLIVTEVKLRENNDSFVTWKR